jgi:hypothetical protein
MGLWNRLTRHQEAFGTVPANAPWRFPQTRQGLEKLATVRREELDGFVEGLFGDRESLDLPRHEKAETVLRIALGMVGSAEGLSLQDIQQNFSDRPLGRRTAERLRDAVERLFPRLEQANPGEVPKRWRLPDGSLRGLADISAQELADLGTATVLLRRENLHAQAASLDLIAAKLKASAKRAAPVTRMCGTRSRAVLKKLVVLA